MTWFEKIVPETGLDTATAPAPVGHLLLAAAMTLALGGAGAAPAFAEVSAAATAPSGQPRQDLPEPILGSLRAALEVYDEVRGDLAADRLEGVPASASRLAGALHLALEGEAGLSGRVPELLEAAALGAESLARAADLASARAAFGEVSRSVLLLAGSDPRLVEGWSAFSCPMAESFGKWIQPTETLENPYMGPGMLRCGSPSDWSVPSPSPPEPAEEASAAGPVFKPGIPGLKMVDVRDHKLLWREIEELQVWERGDRISVAEYRGKVIEKTAHFLGLEGVAADEFTAAATEAVHGIRESFRQGRRTGADPGGLEAPFSSDVQAAVTRVASLLGEEPRHRLFVPECKRWLLRLAFGPGEAKEAREAGSAQASN